MKTLFLLRHAKSSWDDPSLRDFDRPLNKRGRKAAPLIGKFMWKRKLRPDLVLSSPAKRAAQTTALVVDCAEIETEPRYDERLYGASASGLLEAISRIEDSANEVLLVAHNPGMQDMLERLTGEPAQMPTAALARVTLDVERWNDVQEASGHLDWIVRPKELES